MNVFEWFNQSPEFAWGSLIVLFVVLFGALLIGGRTTTQPQPPSAPTTTTGLPIELTREPTRQFNKVIIMIAEGLGSLIPNEMANLVLRKWEAVGKPNDWLVITTGCKTTGPQLVEVMANDDTDAAKRIELHEEMESTIPYVALRNAGFPEEQMLLETKSDNTFGQTREVRLLLQEVTGFTDQELPITIVCHDLHVKRTTRLFKKAGYIVNEIWAVRYQADPTQPLFHMRQPRPIYWALEQLIAIRDRLKGWL